MHLDWDRRPPAEGAAIITTLDAHAAGEPLRIVTGGLPELPGATMLERRRYLQDHLDHVRRALMWEPRGHRDMYGCVLTTPVSPAADLGVLFMHNAGYSTMCGHGVIALVTALLETGALQAQGPQTPVTLDTPAGLVRATAHLDATGHVEHVSFLNVPAFVFSHDVVVHVPGIGQIAVDVAFGGAFYAILPAARVGLQIVPGQTERLTAAGIDIKRAVSESLSIRYPEEPDLAFLYGAILTGPPVDSSHHSQNVCIFADGEVDRSPTGTGVSARLAQLHARGEIAVGEWIVVESILGSLSAFRGRVVDPARVGPYAAVVPEVSGTAYVTGRHTFVIDPRDDLGQGFLVDGGPHAAIPPI